ncbi:unnamed protein product [Rotaria sordida]|uniref:Uncharacterized protein n=1 Tax=Rotaria sordida TaxID=392033 RepID=A0A814HXL2_9BILA|nr:unnamed protein product [Rotaria sordida]CAF1015998.1 unnamed protein product [Rotaria sordida]
MPKEQYTANSQSELHANISEELLSNTLPARIGPYRSLSAKRPRDPSHRKSVSFNDVPIVHEVPLHDTMRNSNCDTFRSWAYTDATPPTSVIPSFYSSQVLLPFNSTSAAAQKMHANRLCSTLYSTPSTTSTTTNRIPDWAIRAKTSKTVSNSEETNTTNENNSTGNPPMIILHIPDERTSRDTTVKTNNQSTFNNIHATHSQTSSTPISSLSHNLEHEEEKKHPYRSAMIPDTDHYRSIPFNYGPLSDSTATYTSMLSTNLIQSNHSSNEQSVIGHTRTARARSATLPGTANYSPIRTNDTVSITPFRATTANLLSNGSNSLTRTVLRPTTIAFQCSQPTNTTINTTNGSSTVNITSTTNNTNQSSTTTNTTKPPIVPSRFGTSAAAAAAAHSRFVIPTNRTLSTSSLNSSAIKYTFAHPTMDSTLINTMTSQATIPKPPPTSYSRSRSAHVLSTRRSAASPVVMMDGQSNGSTTTNSNTNLYSTTKRNPNVRQTYGSYYMHRVLLPTTIH